MIKIFLLLLFVFLSTAAPAGNETVAERFGIHRLLKSTRRNTNSSIVHEYTPTNSSISDESLDDSSRRNLYASGSIEFKPLRAELTSTYQDYYPGGFGAANCVDDSTNTMCHGNNASGDTLTIKLPQKGLVERIVITNREDFEERLVGAIVKAGDIFCATITNAQTSNSVEVIINCNSVTTDTITIETKDWLNLFQVKVFGEDVVTYRKHSGKDRHGGDISCGRYGSHQQLKDACSRDNRCIGYTVWGTYPWCLKTTSSRHIAHGHGHDFYEKIGRIRRECPTDKKGVPCHFPFIYRGVEYNACTNTAYYKDWCSTEVDSNGNDIGQWGICLMDYKACRN